MPDLLREQFPYFRPIVEAFGYRNLEFEGWEADDVIATLAHPRRRGRGRRRASSRPTATPSSSCSDNVCADDDAARRRRRPRLHARARRGPATAIPPEQVPDFIGLKGDTSDNIPGVPGHRRQDGRPADRAVRLARGGARARRRADARRARKALRRARRAGARVEGARDDAARPRARLSTRPRLVLAPPDRSQLKEMFRRFEFRGLLQPRRRARRGAARAAARRASTGDEVALARGTTHVAALQGAALGVAVDDDRIARRARRARSWSSPRDREPRSTRRELVAHDAKALRVDARRRHDARRLPDRARAAPTYELDDLAAEYGVELDPVAEAEEETAALVRRAAAPLRLRDPLRERARERGVARALRDDRAAADARCSPRWRTPASRSTPTAWARSPRASPTGSRSSRRRRTSSPARSSCSARPSRSRAILFEKLELTPGRKGKTGYSTDTRVLRDDPRRARDRGRDRGVARVLEAAQHVPRPAADADRRATAACTRRSTRPSPPPAGSRRRTRTCRRSRSAPSSAARSARRSSPSRATGCSRPTTRRSSCASSRTSRASRSCARRSSAARTSTPRRPPRCSARSRATLTQGRAQRREDGQLRDHLRHLVVRALGEPRDPARGGAGLHRHLPRALPARAGLHRADDRAGRARRLRDDAARPAPPDPGAPRLEPPDALARRAARRQLRSCRARPPTSSRWR